MNLYRLTLDRNSTKSLTRMLQDRVIQLDLYEVEMDYKLLTEYDGAEAMQLVVNGVPTLML